MSNANEHDEPQTPRAPPSPPQSPRVAMEQEPQTPKARGQRELQTPKAPKKQQAPVPKEKPAAVPFVMYLGIEINARALHSLMLSQVVNDFFANHSALKQQGDFHITLFFFSKKCPNKGEIVILFKQFIEEHGAEVLVSITGIGYHEGTCALQVSPTILTKDGSETPVPWTHEKHNHITIALEEGKSAKNSVIAVMKQEESGSYPGDFVPFDPPIVITGNLHPF